LSFQYATGMCLLLENVGGSEQNRSVANVQSDDLWPSRMNAVCNIGVVFLGDTVYISDSRSAIIMLLLFH